MTLRPRLPDGGKGDAAACLRTCLTKSFDETREKREERSLTPIERRTQSPQLNQLLLSPKWCQALYAGRCTLYTVGRLITPVTSGLVMLVTSGLVMLVTSGLVMLVTSRLVTLVTNWGLVAADSAVDFVSHIRRARV